jgi:hypothetical protein
MSEIAKDFDPHVFGVAASLAVAKELAGELEDDPYVDGIDLAVVEENISDAALHVARAIRSVHEEWYENLTTRQSDRAALTLFRRYEPDPIDAGNFVDAVLETMWACIERGRAAVALGWQRRDDDDRYAKVGYEIDAAIEHCERVIFVLDPSAEIGIPSIPDYADDLLESEKRREAIIDNVNAARAAILMETASMN